MKIAISAESTVDMPQDLIIANDIKVTPFTVTLGDKTGLDGEITSAEIIEYVKEHKILPKTSAINYTQYLEHFTAIRKEYDAVIHFSLSSELSSACNNAMLASKDLTNVYVIDSRSLSTGIALLVLYARKLANEGKSAEEIVELASKRVSKVQASFALSRLDYLYKGGRCNALSYFGANVLQIRPQIIVKEGKMIAGKKFRGSYERVVENYCRTVLEDFSNPDLENVFITCTTAEQELIDKIEAMLKERGFKNIYFSHAGATITSHCGENCLGVLYINDGGIIE